MNDDSTSDSGLPEGFLIKDKSGKLKKIKDGVVTDFQAPVRQKSDQQPIKQPASTQPASKLPVPETTTQPPAQIPPVAKPAIHLEKSQKPLAPSAPISSSSKAPFLIEPEDEEEIQQHVEDLGKLITEKDSAANSSIQNVINKIIQECDISFESDVMKKRFTKIVESQLRELRTSIEAKEILMRAGKVGGVELPDEIAEKVVTAANRELGSLRDTGVTTQRAAMLGMAEQTAEKASGQQKESDVEVPSMLAEAPPEFVPSPKPAPEPVEKTAPVPEPEAVKPVEPVQPKPEQATPSPPMPPKAEQKPPPPQQAKKELPVPPVDQPEVPPSEPEVSPETAKLYEAPQSEMPRRVVVNEEDDRPKLVDIKQPRKVIGPVEELGELDLKEFRRLGTTPHEAAAKIFEKIELLEEESWQIRSDGVNAWKQSPLFTRYVSIGQESIVGGITLDEVIKKRTESGESHLQKEEFIAINELNSNLGT